MAAEVVVAHREEAIAEAPVVAAAPAVAVAVAPVVPAAVEHPAVSTVAAMVV